MGAFPTKHKSQNIQVKSANDPSPCSSSNYSSDSEGTRDSKESVAESDTSSYSGTTDQTPEQLISPSHRATAQTVLSANVPDEQKQPKQVKPKESNFIETSEFPYARAKLVHPQTSRDHQESRIDGRQTWSSRRTSLPRPKQQAKHVVFGGHSQNRAERTINPHILWRLHSNGSGINVVPSIDVSRRGNDHMPVSTWRNPNRGYTYFRDQRITDESVQIDSETNNTEIRRPPAYTLCFSKYRDLV